MQPPPKRVSVPIYLSAKVPNLLNSTHIRPKCFIQPLCSFFRNFLGPPCWRGETALIKLGQAFKLVSLVNITLLHLIYSNNAFFYFHFQAQIKWYRLVNSFLSVKLKLILPSQASNLVSRSTGFFRKDRNAHGRGLLFHINEDLNCKVLTNYPVRQDFEF